MTRSSPRSTELTAAACRACGACCSFSPEWPRFSLEDDADLNRIPRRYVDGEMNGHRDAVTGRTSGDALKREGSELPESCHRMGYPPATCGESGCRKFAADIPSARTIARSMTIGRNNLSRADTVTITAIEMGVPSLVEARDAITEFQAMVRNKADVVSRGLELRAWHAVTSNQSLTQLNRTGPPNLAAFWLAGAPVTVNWTALQKQLPL